MDYHDRVIKIQEALGRIEARQLKSSDCRDLAESEFRTFSQWGEDGIIQALLSLVSIEREVFIEFGVSDFKESNCRFLLVNDNWCGLVIDGDQQNIDEIKSDPIYWQHNLKAECRFIERGNIEGIFKGCGVQGPIGLLSIDIDGNDYWVWETIESVDPVVVVVEYNAVFGDQHAITVPYSDGFQRASKHHSCLYFGASIRALIQLAGKKGYSFVGTCTNGCNAFFVRSDQADKVSSKIDGVWAYPSKVRESRNENGGLSYVSGSERAKVIEDLPLIDVETGGEVTLKELGDLYSDEWRNGSRSKLSS